MKNLDLYNGSNGSPVKSHVYLLSMYLKSMSQKSMCPKSKGT